MGLFNYFNGVRNRRLVRSAGFYTTFADFPIANGSQGFALAINTGGLYADIAAVWTLINGSSGISLLPIGAAPNADGATVTGTNLNLEPASGLFGGVVTTGAQTFAGLKTFVDKLTVGLGVLTSTFRIETGPDFPGSINARQQLRLWSDNDKFLEVYVNGGPAFVSGVTFRCLYGFVFYQGDVRAFNGLSVGTLAQLSNDCILECISTTRGFKLPSMTTAQRNAIVAPSAGLMVYDTTLNLPYFYNSVAWVPV